MPETTYVRAATIKPMPLPNDSETKFEEGTHAEDTQMDTVPLKSNLALLNPVSGIYKTKSSALALLMRPVVMLFTPIVFWGGLLVRPFVRSTISAC